MELIIFLKCAGTNARADNLYDTILSFIETIENHNYGFYFCFDESMKKQFDKMKIPEEKIVEVVVSEQSWAKDYNIFLDKYKDKTEWILISHDDLEMRTKNFFDIVLNLTKDKKDDIGWITFTSDYYYAIAGNPVRQSTREGPSLDRNKVPCVFECHNYNLNYYGHTKNHLNLIDLPEPNKLTKVWAIMTPIMLITSKSMKKIGYCEDWTKYTLLIDEDWGLEALKNNLWNIWISNIFYTHPLRLNLRKEKGHTNIFADQARESFNKKWGFDHLYTEESIKMLREKYKDTNIPFFTFLNSYDWRYL